MGVETEIFPRKTENMMKLWIKDMIRENFYLEKGNKNKVYNGKVNFVNDILF